jgi:hypothetical protein
MRSLFFALAFVTVPLAELAAKECTAEQHKANRARMTAVANAAILRADPELKVPSPQSSLNAFSPGNSILLAFPWQS